MDSIEAHLTCCLFGCLVTLSSYIIDYFAFFLMFHHADKYLEPVPKIRTEANSKTVTLTIISILIVFFEACLYIPRVAATTAKNLSLLYDNISRQTQLFGF